MLLQIICVFPCHWPTGLLSSKRGHKIINGRNSPSSHKGKSGQGLTDQPAPAWTLKNSKMVLHSVSAANQAQGSCFEELKNGPSLRLSRKPSTGQLFSMDHQHSTLHHSTSYSHGSAGKRLEIKSAWSSQVNYHWRELPEVWFSSRQKLCRDKHVLVADKTCLLLQQKYTCHDESFAMTYFCCNKTFVTTNILSQKKSHLWQLPPMTVNRCI